MFGFNRKRSELEVWLNISNRTIVRVILMVIVAFIVLAALKRASHALVLIFTAFFLAVALNSPVHWVAKHLPGKRRGSRTLATVVSTLIVVVVLGLFLASITPPLVRQTNNFIHSVPHLIEELHNRNSSLGRLIDKYNLSNELSTISSQLSSRLKNATGSAVSTVTTVGSSIFALLTILVLTFMMLIEGPHWLEKAGELMPKEYRKHVGTLVSNMYQVVKGYVNGQVILAAIAAILITPALFLLHISFPFALMVVIFICGLIPMVGHTIGAIIVTIVALFHSVPSALIILAYYILYQQIENYIIQPRVQANTTNLSPLLVFAAVVIGVNFDGLLGGLIAIPVMACLRVLILYYLENRGKLVEAETTSETK